MPKGEGIAQKPPPEILEELIPPLGPRREKNFGGKHLSLTSLHIIVQSFRHFLSIDHFFEPISKSK